MSFTFGGGRRTKKWLTVCLMLLSMPVAAEESGSGDTNRFTVYFEDGMSVVDSGFDGNGIVLDSICAYVRRLAGAGIEPRFEFVGSTSPNGDYHCNQRLAEKRARNLKMYVMGRLAMEDAAAEIGSKGIDYGKLKDLVVADTNTPNREKVIEILDSVPEVRMAGKRVIEQKKRQLLWLDNGRSYYYMKARMFADLRSVEVALPAMPQPQPQPAVQEEKEPVVPEVTEPVTTEEQIVEQPADTVAVEPQPQPAETATEVGKDEHFVERMALKTNLVYDVLLAPDLEVEYRINDRWSVAIEGTMAWWHNNGKHKYYQLAVISPEVRYWFKTKKPWHGHYIGLFGGQGWYDLENGGRGYRGEGQMAALSYGYMFPVSKHLSFDAEIGVGYMHTRFQEYLPIDGHYVYQQTSKINYFGPLKVKFSLVWRFWPDKRKGGVKYDY